MVIVIELNPIEGYRHYALNENHDNVSSVWNISSYHLIGLIGSIGIAYYS